MQRKWSDDSLIDAVKISANLTQIAELLGVRGGGSFKIMRERIELLGLDTSHFTRRWGPGRRHRNRIEYIGDLCYVYFNTKHRTHTYAVIDNSDVKLIAGFMWSRTGNDACYYASTTIIDEYGRRQNMHMHRLLLAQDHDMEKLEVDHIDGNGLNNSRSNLRACKHAENALNARKHVSSSSKFKGVKWDGLAGVWETSFRGQKIGRFESEREAATAYDNTATKYNAQLALTNKRLGLL